MVDYISEMLLRRLSIEKISQAMRMLMTDAPPRIVTAHFISSHNVIRRVRMRFNEILDLSNTGTGEDEIAVQQSWRIVLLRFSVERTDFLLQKHSKFSY